MQVIKYTLCTGFTIIDKGGQQRTTVKILVGLNTVDENIKNNKILYGAPPAVFIPANGFCQLYI